MIQEPEFLKGKRRITIGDITFALPSSKFVTVDSFYSPFLSFKRPNIKIRVHSGLMPDFKHKRKLFDSKGPWKLYEVNRKEIACFFYRKRLLERVMVSDRCYKKIDLYLKPGAPGLEDILDYPLGEILAINFLSRGRGIIAHSLSINNGGKGILFIGNSGAGKSTMARLVMHKEKAKVLNDDRAIIRKKNGHFRIYGTPWHGDVKVCLPEDAPLEKIFFIKHAKDNTLKELNPQEVVSRLVRCSFLPFWDKKGIEFALKFCDNVAKNIPSYELGFVPDESVVDFLKINK